MPARTAELIAADDVRWSALLERTRHDVYHLPRYVLTAAEHDGGVAAAYYAEDGDDAVLMPLVIRDLPPEVAAPAGWKDATSPYGYGGPIATPGADEHAVSRLVSSFKDVASWHGLVTAFFRLHPLRGVPHRALVPFGTVLLHGPVVYIDLSRPRAQLAAETRRDHRHDIAHLIRAGFAVKVDAWNDFEAFKAAYRMTMRRRGAAPYYSFSDKYFDQLRQLLESRVHLFTVRSPSDEVAAAGLFTTVDGIVEFHLSGTTDAHLRAAPSKLMIDFVRWWAKDRGDAVLNLGGGLGGSAGSLLDFKGGFSASRADFHTWRVTVDAQRYAALLPAARCVHDGNAAANSDYFPAYRRECHG